MNHLANPIFTDETKAREWLEAQVWPDGPFCPHCGSMEDWTRLEGKAHRAGLFQCNACRQQFTVTVGTLFERSKIALTKWLMAVYLLSASKKGIASLQLSRMLGLPYKTAWFMAHRIRAAMAEGKVPGGLGGEGVVIEADETFVGGKAKNRAYRKTPPKKETVVALVERGGRVRSFHVKDAKASTLRPILVTNADRASFLMTDEWYSYTAVGKEFRAHATVRHGDKEYVRDGIFHTNTVEGFFSIFKRGMTGVYQHCGEQHLKRYLAEFDFRYSHRKISDMERTVMAAKGIVGKRLTYRRIGERPNG